MLSVRQFSFVPNSTSTQIFPIGECDTPGTMPWNVVMVGYNMLGEMPILTIVSRYIMLMLLPLSIKTRVNRTLTVGPMKVGSTIKA